MLFVTHRLLRGGLETCDQQEDRAVATFDGRRRKSRGELGLERHDELDVCGQ